MQFKELSSKEIKQLESAPVLISLLAANADGEMDEMEKKQAIKFSHIKTYSSHPLLHEFYTRVEKNFESSIEYYDKLLPKDRKAREEEIKKRLTELEPIIQKLGKQYTQLLHKSFQSYSDHVSKAHRNVLQSFLIPFYIKGLTS